MNLDALEEVFRSVLAAVEPAPLTRAAVASLNFSDEPIAVLAVGKAARAMLVGCVEALEHVGATPVAMLAVGATDEGPCPAGAEVLTGDHPLPGARSLAAAAAIDRWREGIPTDARVLVLLSGGTTSLIAAPVPEIPAADIPPLFDQLHRSGADIMSMNAVRKRVLRHAAGRLTVALAPRRIDLLIASDVLGDDPAFIGSGPCTPDSLTAGKVIRMLERVGAAEALPPTVRHYLDDVHHKRIAETPKPGSAVFRAVTTRILVSNRTAVEAAAAAASRTGFDPVRVIAQPLKGEARAVGTELGSRLVAWRQQLAAGGTSPQSIACTVAGGETTVTLGAGAHGRGGRCQEMALALARELHRLRPRSETIRVLVAGTDGRDGPTDAAGAVVDATTWSRIGNAGRQPDRDLQTHDAYAALDAAGALLRTGPTGTNVNDVVIACVSPASTA
ncbi:MAG: DUF4147 domain-containing protein [Gemmatimonadaceae bacterium]